MVSKVRVKYLMFKILNIILSYQYKYHSIVTLSLLSFWWKTETLQMNICRFFIFFEEFRIIIPVVWQAVLFVRICSRDWIVLDCKWSVTLKYYFPNNRETINSCYGGESESFREIVFPLPVALWEYQSEIDSQPLSINCLKYVPM